LVPNDETACGWLPPKHDDSWARGLANQHHKRAGCGKEQAVKQAEKQDAGEGEHRDTEFRA
jgi:hypothetical protein